ncbi:permease for cytosine/purines, uracil, thiamine, allantoin-domain-containing protein [Calycina marina]|uniref:Permease for cytosine/purines, uracil, thiamine, allantoin-domain-containing protein n=1 Tax=Calycina marina TaxID=1763456 RepID=A0A9P8CJ78_9HELO|nr:permease for cytosine/purines, uracil, thiamine, allantoin-domain-containing protein [Calycina marina]
MNFTAVESVPKNQQLKSRMTSIKAWELQKQKSTLAPDHVWTNEDMDPVPIKNQTWSVWTWMAYWATDTINLGTWETASSIISVGLSWREAIPAIVVGTTCVAIPMVLNGAIGAKLHIPFSVVIRASFGYYFAYFAICSRCVLAMFWLGIQGANGAQAMDIMIRAIWPSYNDTNIPNTIPLDQGITSRGMISYFLFWIIQLPLLLIPPTNLRWLFLIKIVAAPITALATMGWCIHKAGGSGTIFAAGATVTGSNKAYLFLSSMTAVTGSWATLACNIPDFSRYAKTTRGTTSKAQFIQLPFLPLVFTACAVIGIVTTSATGVIYGELYWNPLDIIAFWLESGHGGRAAAFFAATSWYIAQVGTNITANSISAANDLTVLFPKYVNIRRGCIIAAVVGGWVIVPWKIISSASTFLNFMGGYAVFLAPIAGIMAADYWLVKKQHMDVPAMYDPEGRYRYWYGVNWRAVLAMCLAVGPNLPGLGYSIGSNADTGTSTISISAGAKNLYTFNWLYGFTVSIFVYTACSYLVPAKGMNIRRTIYGIEEPAGGVGDGRINEEEGVFEKNGMREHEHESEKAPMGDAMGTHPHVHDHAQ